MKSKLIEEGIIPQPHIMQAIRQRRLFGQKNGINENQDKDNNNNENWNNDNGHNNSDLDSISSNDGAEGNSTNVNTSEQLLMLQKQNDTLQKQLAESDKRIAGLFNSKQVGDDDNKEKSKQNSSNKIEIYQQFMKQQQLQIKQLMK